MGIIEYRYEVICKLNLSEDKHLHMMIHVFRHYCFHKLVHQTVPVVAIGISLI